MKNVIGNQLVLSLTPEGPFEPHIGSFGEFLSSQGYALSSSHRQVILAPGANMVAWPLSRPAT